MRARTFLAGCGIIALAVTIGARIMHNQAAQDLPADARIIAAIQKSDDYDTYPGAFLEATRTALREGYLTIENLEEMGGWLRSTAHKPHPVYFTYGGDMDSLDDRVYVNMLTGAVTRRDP